MTCAGKTLLIALLVTGMVYGGSAQIGLTTGVFATGGRMMSSGTYAAAGTIGQSLIGRSIGTTYAASAGFWGDGAVILGVEEPSPVQVPAELTLMQNYPNPFNPTTTIRYGLPRRSRVSLEVFNTLGQQVARLAQGEEEAGFHEVRFGGRDFSSGVYYYRLRAGDVCQTRRLVLVR
jgi:hypothetical protein